MARCDKVFSTLTDEAALQLTFSPRGQCSRLGAGALYRLAAHNNEEYGHLAVHLRLKGIVPPSSEGGGMRGRGGQ